MDQNITQAVAAYDTADQEIANLEAKIEVVKKTRTSLAEAIAQQFGNGPHTIGDRILMVSRSRGNTSYLRAPARMPGSKSTKKAKPTSFMAAQETQEPTQEVTQEATTPEETPVA